MTRCPLTTLAIRRECLMAEARDMAGAAKTEAALKAVNLEILGWGKK